MQKYIYVDPKEKSKKIRKIVAEKKREYYHKNKEKILEKKKEWRENNKDKLLERAREKVECDICKSFVRRDGLKEHQRTKKCMNIKSNTL
jgi:hypothetical protein